MTCQDETNPEFSDLAEVLARLYDRMVDLDPAVLPVYQTADVLSAIVGLAEEAAAQMRRILTHSASPLLLDVFEADLDVSARRHLKAGPYWVESTVLDEDTADFLGPYAAQHECIERWMQIAQRLKSAKDSRATKPTTLG